MAEKCISPAHLLPPTAQPCRVLFGAQPSCPPFREPVLVSPLRSLRPLPSLRSPQHVNKYLSRPLKGQTQNVTGKLAKLTSPTISSRRCRWHSPSLPWGLARFTWGQARRSGVCPLARCPVSGGCPPRRSPRCSQLGPTRDPRGIIRTQSNRPACEATSTSGTRPNLTDRAGADTVRLEPQGAGGTFAAAFCGRSMQELCSHSGTSPGSHRGGFFKLTSGGK